MLTITMALLTMTLLLSSVKESVAAAETSDQATVTATAQERKKQRTLVQRNAAAKKLKADLDSKKPAQSSQVK
jgi:hypothetical protein